MDASGGAWDGARLREGRNQGTGGRNQGSGVRGCEKFWDWLRPPASNPRKVDMSAGACPVFFTISLRSVKAVDRARWMEEEKGVV